MCTVDTDHVVNSNVDVLSVSVIAADFIVKILPANEQQNHSMHYHQVSSNVHVTISIIYSCARRNNKHNICLLFRLAQLSFADACCFFYLPCTHIL